MRRIVLAMLVGTVAMLDAGAAKAQSYSASAWHSTYRAIPIPGGEAPVPVTLSGTPLDGIAWQWSLPFEVVFNGVAYTRVNVGQKGYVTFGTNTASNVVNAVSLGAFRNAGQNPTNLVAAWWADHFCDATTRDINSQVVGEAPNRAYVIQWHCSLRSGSGSSSTRFEAQLWFFEGTHVIRASYGSLNIGAVGDYMNAAWGIKRTGTIGEYGPNRNNAPVTCYSNATCTGVGFFPRQATIQYGLTATSAPVLSKVRASFTNNGGRLGVTAETTFLNLGEEEAQPSYDLYLSRGATFNPAASIHLARAGGVLPAAAGGVAGTATFTEVGESGAPHGAYRVCAVFESTSYFGPPATLSACSDEIFSWGVDLTGTIVQIPSVAAPSDRVSLRFSFRNQGAVDSSAFGYRLTMVPDDPRPGIPPAPREDVHTGRIEAGLMAGSELVVDLEDLELPPLLRGDRYTFVLTVDPDRETGDVDTANNVSFSLLKIEILKPKITLKRVDHSFAEGECIYGEPMTASIEICNAGTVAAVGYHPGVALGRGSNIGLLEDGFAAASPQVCDSPFSSNYRDCQPSAGQAGVCVERTCRYSCEVNGDCQAWQRCLLDQELGELLGDPEAKSCVNYLDPPATPGAGTPCQLYVMDGVVPVADQWGRRYLPGPQRLHFTNDLFLALSEPAPAVFSTTEFACDEALPDFVPVSMSVVTEMEAGQTYPIERLIRNTRFIEQYPGTGKLETVDFQYRYYFASPGVEMSANQIPLELMGTGTARVGRKAENLLTDRVVVPEHLAPGVYELGLIVDPFGQHRERSKTNNILVHSAPIRILEARFGIIPPELPAAVVGKPFVFQFSAKGGAGPYGWTAENLPAGLELDGAGRLFGTPLDVGVFSFKLKVRSGDRSSERILALRILPPVTLLEVSSAWLPPAVRLRSYGGWIDGSGTSREGIPLAASGGVPPYRWELAPEDAGDRLPQGITLDSPEGILRGAPTALSSSSSFTVKVTDANGAWATRRLEILVVEGEELVITSRLFSDGVTAQAYDSCIEAAGGDPDGSLTWSIEASTIPPGLSAETRGRSACLKGTPSVCGNYVVKASVSDTTGRSYASSLSLSVECGQLLLKRRTLPELRRGEIVELRLEATTGSADFQLEQGTLPPGLSLAENGVISGTVDAQADFGSYDFLISLRDDAGRRGMAAVTLVVQARARTPMTTKDSEGSGCSSSGGDVAGWGLLAVASMLGLRGRRRLGGSSGLVGLVAVAAIGLSACGDDSTTTTTLPLCEGVVCENANEICDPADGLCKCGGASGVFCGAGEVCALEPEPHCTSGLCDFVECDRGESCDLLTGECSCGGSRCSEDEVCVDRSCKPLDRCADIRCDEGMACDPADGACKCSGEICDFGESCVEGKCAHDPCFGVTCPFNSACNPRDGNCHCAEPTGPICMSGEACVPSASTTEEAAAFACVESKLCEATSCGGGTTCDPADGLCKCGGVGSLAPVCFDGQTCVDGQCKGGLLCEPGGVPVECGRGFSCDPKDGVCKCGGVDGVVCGPGESCSNVFGSFSCRKACTVTVGASGECPSGQSCYLDRNQGSGASFCAPTGPQGVGQDCESFNDCGPGLYCSRANKCRRFCHPSEGDLSCGDTSDSVCLPFKSSESAQEDLGYCIADVG